MTKQFNGYFTDRNMDVLGLVSTTNPNTLKLVSDEETETIDKGVTTFTADVSAHANVSAGIETPDLSMIKAGNYFLYEGVDGLAKMFTIIDVSGDAPDDVVNFYAEDGGLDTINEIVGDYEAKEAMVIAKYFELFLKNSGFKIGTNELGEAYSRKLKWEGESSVTERLRSVAHQFEHAEINFSFEVKGMRVTEKYVNIYAKRGEQTGITLELNKHVNRITSTETIANLATSLSPKGAIPEGKKEPITLKGHTYDDGRFFVENGFLRDRESNEIWSRFLSEGRGAEGGYINRPYNYDTTNVVTLRNSAITELKKVSQVAKNFEVDISILPDEVRIGDTINIVNQKGELYLEARVLQLKRSRVEDKAVAILGDYLIKESGINEKLLEIAEMMNNLPKGDSSSLWIRYADDDKGNGFSASPANKKFVAMKTAINNPVPSDDPADYEGLWAKFMGPEGESIEGPPGKDGQPTYTWIRYADNVSGGGISAESAGKKYIGFAYNKDTATPSNTPKDYQWFLAKGEDGKNGLSITSVQSLFYQSTSATSLVGGTWVTTAPVWVSGKFSWTKTKTVFSDSTSSETTPVNITGGIGEDGKPTYSWLMYAEDDKGKGISASPVGKYYMGLAHNKPVEKPSTVASDYKWSAMYDEEKMAELQDQINNIQIGGTNLIRDSAFDEGFKHFPIAQKGFSVDNTKKFMDQNTLKFQWEQGVGTFPAVVNDFIEVREAGLVGEEMTLSVYVFIPEDGVLSSMAYVEVCGYETTSQTANNLAGISSRIDISKNTEKGKWQRLSVTFTVQESNASGAINYVKVLLRHRAQATPTVLDKFWYALPQLERGNKVSDWNRNPADTPTTGDLSNVQTELQNRLDTIVMPVTQPNAPSNPKEGMVWWQNNLAGEIIGMFKYEKGKWEPQTIQQSLLNIIELNAVIITGSTITGTEIAGSTIISTFDEPVVAGAPIRRRGTLTIEKGHALIEYEQYDVANPNEIINKGETRVDELGVKTMLKDKDDVFLLSSQYGPLGININDRSKSYGQVNLGYNDLLAIPETAFSSSMYNTGFAQYDAGASNQPRYSRNNRMIQLSGAIRNNILVEAGKNATMAILPVEIRPARMVRVICQGSGVNRYALAIYPDGTMWVDRYGTTSHVAVAVGSWLNIACTYVAGN